VRTSQRDKDEVWAYVESRVNEKVTHLEKAASEMVGPVRHDIWDAHCLTTRWWVVTNPTNLYSQDDFKSRDVVLTFHIGVAIRTEYANERDVPVAPGLADLLPGSWRRWQQAFDELDSGDEAETFQSVGVRLRECLVSFIGETCSDGLVSEGEVPPKAADFKGWTDLLANDLASGKSASHLRSYLKDVSVATWDYVNWLTHAKNAIRMDAEIGLKLVEHILGMFTAAKLRIGAHPTRCEVCLSYEVLAGVCRNCDWIDPEFQQPELPDLTSGELKRRLSESCTPSSDISTFLGPDDFKEV
jgi:hypothetical protein